MRESSTVSAPPVLVAAASHVGRVRATNEDRVYADVDRGSFAVIDGVGGQAAGEYAAQTALETIRQRLQIQIGTPAERVREAIALANDHIHQQALAHPDRRGMACVLTLVLLQNGTLTAGHVGDTRLYKMRGGVLRKLTHDHSPIGEREDSGELSESEAMRHPRRNEVYREVGTEPRAPNDPGFIEVVEETFEPDAALLLCSDGLSDALAGAAIAATIERHAGDPARVADDLIERANDASGKDNVSIVYIEGTAFARDVRRTQPSGESTPTPITLTSPPSPSSTPSPQRDNVPDFATIVRTGATGESRTTAQTTTTTTTAARAAMPVTATGSRRVLWFALGLLAGVAIALGAAYYMRDAIIPLIPSVADPPAPGPRTLTVGSVSTDSAAPSFATIADALAQARAGDTVRVGPGEYREQLVINDGVTVIGSPAREAIVRAPAQTVQPWTAVIVTAGQQGVRVSGLKIAGDPQAPIAIGVRVLGNAVLDDLDVSGMNAAGIAFDGGTLSLIASVVHANAGPGLAVRGGSARIVHNVFTRNSGTANAPPPPPGPAAPRTRPSAGGTAAAANGGGADIVLTESARTTFLGNVIGGDPAQHVRGLPTDQIARFRETNFVLPPASRAAASTRPSPRATPR